MLLTFPAVIGKADIPGRVLDRFVEFLFVAVLVTGQLGLLLHQSDIEHHSGGKECSICLAAHNLDHPLTTSFMPPATTAAAVSAAAPPTARTVSRTPARLVARSPPVSPLQV